jgi:hypothetical protein
MIELPVDHASVKLTNPNGCDAQMMISSASRDRWSEHCTAAVRNSIAKSRSDTLSSELAVGPSKPSARAVASLSIGKPVPASAALPSGQRLSRTRASENRPRSRPSIST